MNNDEIPITILVDDDSEETPLVPDTPTTTSARVSEAVNQAGSQVQDVAQRAWQSEKRRQATEKVEEKVTAVLNKGSDAVQTRVNQMVEEQAKERLRQIDWQQVAKSGMVGGLRWLSQRLHKLADKFDTPSQSDTPQQEEEA